MKAISYVMSVMLMLLVVSVACFTAFTMTQSWLGEALESYTYSFSSPFISSLEEFSVEEVKLEYSGPYSYVTVYLRNSGGAEVRISSVYFDGRRAEIVESSQGGASLLLMPQESGWLKLRLEYLVSKGELHEIVVWSDEGKKETVDWVF